MKIDKAKEIDSLPHPKFKYSICTLVSRIDEYEEMLESFYHAGFDTSFCEYLYIDNSKENKYDAYEGLNLFLSKSKGEFIILCHQDILINFDNLEILERRIDDIQNKDKNWAIISNAGAVGIKNIVIRITEPLNGLQKVGNPPREVISVDENFILVKKNANLGLSIDLKGFHLYGTDLCIHAISRGFSCYVVNFNLLHKSKGNADFAFYNLRKKFIKKFTKAWKGRYIQTTITKFYISGSKIENLFYSSKIMMFLSRKFYKWKFRKETQIKD